MTLRIEMMHAGLSAWWKASPKSVRLCVANAVAAAREHGFQRLTMPLIGTGHGGLSDQQSRMTVTLVERAPGD